jgi:hypothetical protein
VCYVLKYQRTDFLDVVLEDIQLFQFIEQVVSRQVPQLPAVTEII